MAKGDSLKRYKAEQKEQTRKNIQETIKRLKLENNEKITVSKIAKEVGLTRSSLYANYKDLLTNITKESKTITKKMQSELSSKDSTIQKLKKENNELKKSNSLLMDQVVALKKMLNREEK